MGEDFWVKIVAMLAVTAISIHEVVITSLYFLRHYFAELFPGRIGLVSPPE